MNIDNISIYNCIFLYSGLHLAEKSIALKSVLGVVLALKSVRGGVLALKRVVGMVRDAALKSVLGSVRDAALKSVLGGVRDIALFICRGRERRCT